MPEPGTPRVPQELCHHPDGGADRVHRSKLSRSRQYCRAPNAAEITTKSHPHAKANPSADPDASYKSFGPSPNSRNIPRGRATRIPDRRQPGPDTTQIHGSPVNPHTGTSPQPRPQREPYEVNTTPPAVWFDHQPNPPKNTTRADANARGGSACRRNAHSDSACGRTARRDNAYRQTPAEAACGDARRTETACGETARQKAACGVTTAIRLCSAVQQFDLPHGACISTQARRRSPALRIAFIWWRALVRSVISAQWPTRMRITPHAAFWRAVSPHAVSVRLASPHAASAECFLYACLCGRLVRMRCRCGRLASACAASAGVASDALCFWVGLLVVEPDGGRCRIHFVGFALRPGCGEVRYAG